MMKDWKELSKKEKAFINFICVKSLNNFGYKINIKSLFSQ